MTGIVAHCPISSLHLIMRVETSLVMWLHITGYHPECGTDKLVCTSLPTVPLHIFLRLSFFTVKRQHFLLVQHLGCSDSTPHIFFTGCGRSCGAACGCPMCGFAVAGGALPAVHEGGGDTFPWQEKCVIYQDLPP